MKKSFSSIAILFLITLLLTGCNPSQPGGLSSTVTESTPSAVPTWPNEGYYLFQEYDIDISLETVFEGMTQRGYTVTKETLQSDNPKEVAHYVSKPNNAEIVDYPRIFVIECETKQAAQTLYTDCLSFGSNYNHVLVDHPFEHAKMILRINNVVYYVGERTTAPTDLMDILGLSLPEPTPLIQGKIVESKPLVGYEEALVQSKELGYTVYDHVAYQTEYEELFKNYCGMVSPERDAYLFLVKMPALDSVSPEAIKGELTYENLADRYLELFSWNNKPELFSKKLVLIAEDTFVVGTTYHVDRFIERMQKLN